MAAIDLVVKEGTKTSHVYEHSSPITKAVSSCGCVEVLNINDHNLLFSYKAPKIEQKTKEHPLYKGYLQVSKLIVLHTKSGKATLQINVRIDENQ